MPHDVADLFLAPLVLVLDSRIEELGSLDLEQLGTRVALVSGKPDWSRDLRESGLLEAVRHLIDWHEWELSWDPRGLRLAHADHKVVLGVPPVFAEFLTGVAVAAGRPTAQ